MFTSFNACSVSREKRSAALLMSQKANRLLSKLKNVNIESSLIEPWHEDLLNHLFAELAFNHQRLDRLEPTWRDLPLIAFCSRSMLELGVWVEFCCKSRQNARRFYEDKFKDGRELLAALSTLVHSIPGVLDADEVHLRIGEARNRLQELAKGVGANFIDDSFTKVLAAAREIEVGEFFASLNKVCSKFAHPTAMMVANYLTEENRDTLAHFVSFFEMFAWAIEEAALTALCTAMEQLGVDPS